MEEFSYLRQIEAAVIYNSRLRNCQSPVGQGLRPFFHDIPNHLTLLHKRLDSPVINNDIFTNIITVTSGVSLESLKNLNLVENILHGINQVPIPMEMTRNPEGSDKIVCHNTNCDT
jgi:hypothetical protein